MDSDEINITKEDQMEINRFAGLTQRLSELEDAARSMQEEAQRLQDGEEELMLGEDMEEVPYLFGDVFISLPLEEVQARLETASEDLKKEISSLQQQVSEIKREMGDLKAKLYGKFGDKINLEA